MGGDRGGVKQWCLWVLFPHLIRATLILYFCKLDLHKISFEHRVLMLKTSLQTIAFNWQFSNLFWVQDTFTLLTIIEDLKGDLFIWILSTNVYHV